MCFRVSFQTSTCTQVYLLYLPKCSPLCSLFSTSLAFTHWCISEIFHSYTRRSACKSGTDFHFVDSPLLMEAFSQWLTFSLFAHSCNENSSNTYHFAHVLHLLFLHAQSQQRPKLKQPEEQSQGDHREWSWNPEDTVTPWTELGMKSHVPGPAQW